MIVLLCMKRTYIVTTGFAHMLLLLDLHVFEFFFLIDHDVYVPSFIYDRQFKAGTVGSIKTAVRGRLFQRIQFTSPKLIVREISIT